MMQITFIICFLTLVIIKIQFDRLNIIQRINVANIKLKTLTKHQLNVILLLESTTIPPAIVDELVTSKHIVTKHQRNYVNPGNKKRSYF